MTEHTWSLSVVSSWHEKAVFHCLTVTQFTCRTCHWVHTVGYVVIPLKTPSLLSFSYRLGNTFQHFFKVSLLLSAYCVLINQDLFIDFPLSQPFIFFLPLNYVGEVLRYCASFFFIFHHLCSQAFSCTNSSYPLFYRISSIPPS